MNDLEVIRRIEAKLEFPLKKVALEEIEKTAEWPSKVYAVDGNDNVIGLQLDGYAVSLYAELADLSLLTMLVLRDAHLERPEVLKTLKGLALLDLSRTSVTDLSFLKELKGLASLNGFSTNMSFLRNKDRFCVCFLPICRSYGTKTVFVFVFYQYVVPDGTLQHLPLTP